MSKNVKVIEKKRQEIVVEEKSKNKGKESSKVGGLEDEVKKKEIESFSGSFDLKRLREFLDDSDVGAPVLERIENMPRIVTRGPRAFASQEELPDKERNNDPFKYDASFKYQNETQKYIPSEAQIMPPLQRVEFTKVGRENPIFANRTQQEMSFDRFSEMKGAGSSEDTRKYERYETPQRFEVSEAGRENIFEKEKRKYEPKLPKH